MSIGYTQLLVEVGFYLGYGRDTTVWTAEQSANAAEMVRSGTRQFYWPPPLDVALLESMNRTRFSKENPEAKIAIVRWSFLSPQATMVVGTADFSYDLPADFGGAAKSFTFRDGATAAPLTSISEEHLRGLQAGNREAGRPEYYAVRPKASTGAGNQRWEVLLYPTPDKAYTLLYRYDVLPPMLSANNPYPLGGPAHADTLLASCLAVSEERTNDKSSVHRARFMVLLAASAQFDSTMAAEVTKDTWPVGEKPADTLDITYPDLLRHVGQFLDYGWDTSRWTRDQFFVADDLVQSGLRQFYKPVPLSMPQDPAGPYKPAKPSHRWSFLTLTDTVSLLSGTSEYQLPDDFGGELVEDMHFSAGAEQVHIRRVSQDLLLDLFTDNNAPGPPQYVSIIPVTSLGLGRQVWKATFYPKPDSAYEVVYQHVATPPRLTALRPFPLGGVEHAETILTSCMAAAEARMKPTSEVFRGRFQERLAASIAADTRDKPADVAWPLGHAKAATLDITYDQLVMRVGHELGIGWVPTTWSVEERQRVDMAIQSGLRQFYTPAPLRGERYGYEWTFLRPIATLTTIAAQTTYDLPADFSSIDGPITYAPGATLFYRPIEIVAEHQVRSFLSAYTASLRPAMAAIRPKAMDQTTWTRYEIIMCPIPDAAYVLTYRYRVNMLALGDANQYPPGAQQHAETILESCLAAAERMKDGKEGMHTNRFRELLAASVSADRKSASPDGLGYNRDMSDRAGLANGNFPNPHAWQDTLVTYNGSVPL